MSSYSDKSVIFVTGGDNGIGEIVRGDDVLHIDYDEAEDNLDYARQALENARQAKAPAAVIESLEEIVSTNEIYIGGQAIS